MATTLELIVKLGKKHPQLESRCRKAELLEVVTKQRLYWTVQSQSDPEKMYDVWLNQNCRCSCVDSATGQAPKVAGITLCKHTIRVLCEKMATE